jgi:hypothetical protein
VSNLLGLCLPDLVTLSFLCTRSRYLPLIAPFFCYAVYPASSTLCALHKVCRSSLLLPWALLISLFAAAHCGFAGGLNLFALYLVMLYASKFLLPVNRYERPCTSPSTNHTESLSNGFHQAREMMMILMKTLMKTLMMIFRGDLNY